MRSANSKRPRRETTGGGKEFDFQPGKLKRVPAAGRHKLPPEAFEPRNIRVHVQIPLDLDVVSHFKKRARGRKAENFQVQINNALRSHIERKERVAELVNNEQFIAAVAERVQIFLMKCS